MTLPVCDCVQIYAIVIAGGRKKNSSYVIYFIMNGAEL